MTVSEFETLRADLAAFRAGVTAEFAGIKTEISGVKTEVSGIKTDIATLRVMINAKPDASTIYQAVLAIVAAMFAMVVGTAVLLKTIGMMG